MKKILFKNYITPAMICVMAIISITGFAKNPLASSNHDYESTKLKIGLQLPDEWQSKVKIEETDNQVMFKYVNPGGEPVFLLSINKVSETQWMAIKDQIPGVKLLSHKDGNIVYAEKTEKTKIKGTNNQEFNSIVSKINEVLQSYKEV